MSKTKIVLSFIIEYLSANRFNSDQDVSYQLITFFDQRYPKRLYKYCFLIPIIYFEGEVELLADVCAIIITHSPSYYAQKIINQLRQSKSLICLKSNANSITKESSLCDIIYCNDVCELQKNKSLLMFSVGVALSDNHQLELIGQMITTLYVVEGYPNASSFEFIAQCIDNQVIISAVPTNIYLSGSMLPNQLLAQGITPLLLN